MQWLQDQNQSNVDNVINVRCEASRHSRTKRGIIRKLKLMNLKQTEKKSGTCTGASVNLRMAASLELVL